MNSVLLRLTFANLKIIARNRQAMFWAMAFPLIFVVVFGVFFPDRVPMTTIAVLDRSGDEASVRIVDGLEQIDSFSIEPIVDEDEARVRIADGNLGYLLIIPQGFQETISASPPATATLVYDDSDLASGVVVSVVQRLIDQINLELADAPRRVALVPEGILATNVSFLDFVLPGLAIWGVMSYSVIGLATTLASYREKKILTRILATPLKVRVFFTALMLAYLLLALIQATIILGVGALIFGVSLKGNLLYVALLILLGNIVFLNMGFIVGAFSKTVQAASGLGNAVILPMMFFSGVFFPTDGLPDYLKLLIGLLPLAPLLEAVRGVVIEGRPIWEFPVQIATLLAWIALTAFAAIKVFKFR